MKLLFAISFFLLFFSFAAAQYTLDSVPVRLKSFDASKITNANKLQWSVVCYLQYAKFQIQRSYDAVNYTTINTSTADQLRCRQPFEYEDKTANGKVFYRILAGDLDGRVFTSKITVVYGAINGFDINAISPTLITSQATVTISSAVADNAVAQVTSIEGMMVFKKSVLLNRGNNDIVFNFSSLSKGAYIFTCRNSSGILQSLRFIKL